MTARSVLNMVADDLCSDGMNGETIGDKDAALLRKLSNLCEIYCEMIDEYETTKPEVVTFSMRALREDFRQAGYGEK